jgi:ribosomal protein L11 methyltransferase
MLPEPPQMTAVCLSIPDRSDRHSDRTIEGIALALEQQARGGVEILLSTDTPEPPLARPEPGRAMVVAIAATEEEAAHLWRAYGSAIDYWGAWRRDFEANEFDLFKVPLSDTPWLGRYLARNPPNLVGPFWIATPWHAKPPGGETPIRIRPGGVFGDGAHATTQLCLLALAKALERRSCEMCVLDLGCGTGILSVAAALQGAARVLAVDVSQRALAETQRNCELNGVVERVKTIHSLLFEDDWLPSEGFRSRFGLVVANILYEPLAAMAQDVVARIEPPDGVLILSGFRDTKATALTAAYQKHGLELRDVLYGPDGWVALVLGFPRLPHRWGRPRTRG